MKIGYARVSTVDQNLDGQLDALNIAGCDRVFTDKLSGSLDERSGLQAALSQARSGDTLVVTRLDRLGRSLPNLVKIVGDLEANKINFCSLNEQIDTGSPSGRLAFHIFASLAEFERNLISARTKAGLAAARARGRLGGRKRLLEPLQVRIAQTLPVAITRYCNFDIFYGFFEQFCRRFATQVCLEMFGKE